MNRIWSSNCSISNILLVQFLLVNLQKTFCCTIQEVKTTFVHSPWPRHTSASPVLGLVLGFDYPIPGKAQLQAVFTSCILLMSQPRLVTLAFAFKFSRGWSVSLTKKHCTFCTSWRALASCDTCKVKSEASLWRSWCLGVTELATKAYRHKTKSLKGMSNRELALKCRWPCRLLFDSRSTVSIRSNLRAQWGRSSLGLKEKSTKLNMRRSICFSREKKMERKQKKKQKTKKAKTNGNELKNILRHESTLQQFPQLWSHSTRLICPL